MTQRHLFKPSIEDQFQAYRARHPEVYSALVYFARQAQAHGAKVGIKALFERVRWEMRIGKKSEDDYLLNNNYSSHYARLIMQQEPDLAGIFETRRMRT